MSLEKLSGRNARKEKARIAGLSSNGKNKNKTGLTHSKYWQKIDSVAQEQKLAVHGRLFGKIIGKKIQEKNGQNFSERLIQNRKIEHIRDNARRNNNLRRADARNGMKSASSGLGRDTMQTSKVSGLKDTIRDRMSDRKLNAQTSPGSGFSNFARFHRKSYPTVAMLKAQAENHKKSNPKVKNEKPVINSSGTHKKAPERSGGLGSGNGSNKQGKKSVAQDKAGGSFRKLDTDKKIFSRIKDISDDNKRDIIESSSAVVSEKNRNGKLYDIVGTFAKRNKGSLLGAAAGAASAFAANMYANRNKMEYI